MQSPGFVLQSGDAWRRGLRFSAEAGVALLILAASFGMVAALGLVVTLGLIRAVS
jgi:hypothetical protein